jgi:predicted secreted protein
MKTRIIFILLIISTFFGCSESTSPTETCFDSSVNGKYISVTSGNKFIVELDVYADAGYRWDYTISNTKIMEVDSMRFRPKNPDVNVCGGVTIQTIYFKAIQPGRSKVYLYEHQPWEEDTPPINTVTFNVRVK